MSKKAKQLGRLSLDPLNLPDALRGVFGIKGTPPPPEKQGKRKRAKAKKKPR